MALFRSYLFAPGNSEKLLGRVFEAGADAVVLDLEDAVPPAEKNRARGLTAAAVVARASAGGPAVFVRVDAPGSVISREDLDAVALPALTGIRLPKVESAEDVRRVDAALLEIERARGLAAGGIELQLTLETARGVHAAAALAAASPRVRNLCFGAADFCQDVGAEPSADEAETLLARSQLVLASRVAGIDPPVASVHTQLADEEGLRRTSEAARRLGFFGRSCIHPRQLPVVNAAFTPRAEDVENARRIVAAFDAAAAAGSGALALGDGQFVDLAVVRRARRLVALAGSLLPEVTR